MPRRSPAHAALGAAIREARDQARMSQEQLADAAGVHRTYLGGIERGERNPSYTNLRRIAEALDIPLSQLLLNAEDAAGN